MATCCNNESLLYISIHRSQQGFGGTSTQPVAAVKTRMTRDVLTCANFMLTYMPKYAEAVNFMDIPATSGAVASAKWFNFKNKTIWFENVSL